MSPINPSFEVNRRNLALLNTEKEGTTDDTDRFRLFGDFLETELCVVL